MSDTTTSYAPRDFRRVCDVCGNLYNRSQLTRRRKWVFCDNCEDRGTRIIEEENEQIGRMRPFRILPVPNPKPLLIDNLYNYLTEEAAVFDLIVSTAPPALSGGVSPTYWPAIYLGQILQQGTRPTVWLTTAARVLRLYVDNLLSGQFGSSTTDPKYGGITNGTSCLASSSALGGVAFLLAYTTLGDAKYLAAADRCATFLRHAQCCDLLVSGWTISPATSLPYHLGGLSSVVTVSGSVYSTSYLLSDVIALWFFKMLSGIRSPTTVYGNTTSNSFFSAATSAPLSQMISELSTFVAAGVVDSSAGNALVTGLSTAKPQATYVAATNGGAGPGAWTANATIASTAITQALLGIFQASGANAQVTSVLAWLAAFGANAANATPIVNTAQQTLDGISGTYSPAVAPATTLTATAPFTEATGALYDLAALGQLAPLLSPAALRSARGSVSSLVPYSTFFMDQKYLGPLGRAGLSLQPHSTATTTVLNPTLAAQFGSVYRYSNP